MAALGDYVVAGTGALANSINEAGVSYRGVSFATGALAHTVEEKYQLILTS